MAVAEKSFNPTKSSARQYYLLDANDHELKSPAPDSIQSWYQLNPLSAVDVAENWQPYRVASFDRAVEVANISTAGRKVEIKQMVEGNGCAYLSISGALDRWRIYWLRIPLMVGFWPLSFC